MPMILVSLAIGIALMALSFLMTPKIKQPRQETPDLDLPKADAGKPIPIVFGTVTIKDANILWYGEKTTAVNISGAGAPPPVALPPVDPAAGG